MIKKMFANLFDEIILLGVSAILYLLTNLILGAAGFKVLQPAVFLTTYLFISNVVYFTIMENSTTLGKKILKLNGTVKVKETEAVIVEENEAVIVEENEEQTKEDK